MNKLFTLCIMLSFTLLTHAQALGLIPYPNSVEINPGTFRAHKSVALVYPDEIESEIMQYKVWLHQQALCIDKKAKQTIRFKAVKSLGEATLATTPNEEKTAQEAYTLSIQTNEIVINYTHPAGAFYAIQTLKQLAGNSMASLSLPCVTITDRPAFSWRAYMLDDGRYFKGKEIVKQMLDEMATLKLNVFHWHLTEDVGWRIEIKKYPRLTEIGARRDSCRFGALFDSRPHNGYYTQEDIRDIIRYAAERHITIIPEIDMPGHATAAIAAYPILGTHRQPLVMGNSYDVINVCDPQAIKMLEDIIDEVVTLFPAEVMHIGGDEVGTSVWQASPQVNAYMKEKGIKSYAGLQLDFTNHLSNYLSKKGKRMMGWNEITGDLHPDNNSTQQQQLAAGTIVHFWEGDISLVKKSIEKGFEVVNSDRHHTYLDYPYDVTPLAKAYSFNPIPEGLSNEEGKLVKGLGCQMWGEKIRQIEDFYFYTFPRIAAYAECGWTREEHKNYKRFEEALQPIITDWKAKGYYTSSEYRK